MIMIRSILKYLNYFWFLHVNFDLYQRYNKITSIGEMIVASENGASKSGCTQAE